MINQIGLTRTWMTGEFEYHLGQGINLQIKVDGVAVMLESLGRNNFPLFMELEKNGVERMTMR